MFTFEELIASLPPLAPRRKAPWPVHGGSKCGPVETRAIPKKDAARLFHDARRFERQTWSARRKKKRRARGGALGQSGLAVLHALIFDFLNNRTGQLNPSHQAIADAACVAVSTVKRALDKLKEAGVITWTSRYDAILTDEGKVQLRQQTNAYVINPTSEWVGYVPLREAPPPYPEAWGARPLLPDMLTEACAPNTSLAEMVRILEQDHHDSLAQAFAKMGRRILGRSR